MYDGVYDEVIPVMNSKLCALVDGERMRISTKLLWTEQKLKIGRGIGGL